MKSRRFILESVVLVLLAVGVGWMLWPRGSSASGTVPAAGKAAAATKLAPAVAVEEPKTAPAKPGNAPRVSPADAAKAEALAGKQAQLEALKEARQREVDDVTATSLNSSGKLPEQVMINSRVEHYDVYINKLQNEINGFDSPATTPAEVRAQIQGKQARLQMLELLKQNSQEIIANALASAKGDPAKLANVETMRQQYDTRIKEMQNQIDAMDSQATDGP